MDDQEKELSISGVAAVDRAAAVLKAFRRGDGALSMTELSRRTGLVKTTVMRLALSLERAGLMHRNPDGTYRLGYENLRLGSIYQEQFGYEELITPTLRALVEATSETASFYVRRGEHRLCLFRVESPQRLRLYVRPGDLLPMDEASVSRVLREGEDRSVPCAMSPVYTSGKRDPHVASMAAPVFGTDERLLGALSIAGPVSRFDAARARAFSPLLESKAAELTRQLGGRGNRSPA